jgi:hypothetical protein
VNDKGLKVRLYDQSGVVNGERKSEQVGCHDFAHVINLTISDGKVIHTITLLREIVLVSW